MQFFLREPSFASAKHQFRPAGKTENRETASFLITMLDQFYEDPANLNVPVVFGMGYCKGKFEGSTPAELAESVAKMRALSSALIKSAQADKGNQ